jgi:hypothetical protein
MKTKIKNRFTARGWRSLIVLTGPRLGAGPGCTQVWVNPSTRGEYKLGQLQGFVDRDFTAAQVAAKIALKDLVLRPGMIVNRPRPSCAPTIRPTPSSR